MRQKWGQNFLEDEGVCRRIVAALGAGKADAVLEIGPGRGALTRFLVGRVKALTAVELDRGLAPRLQRRWAKIEGVSIIQADFLGWPLPALPAGSLKVVSNLPYSAAGAILGKLLDWPAWERAVVMVQKEVADRICAGPGTRDYGVLSLAVQAKARARRLFDVKPGAFRPPPRILSTVLELSRLPSSRLSDEAAFFRAVRAAFGQRRKTILNSLSHGLGIDKSAAEAALRTAGLDPGARAETVDLGGFERLAQAIGTSTQRI